MILGCHQLVCGKSLIPVLKVSEMVFAKDVVIGNRSAYRKSGLTIGDVDETWAGKVLDDYRGIVENLIRTDSNLPSRVRIGGLSGEMTAVSSEDHGRSDMPMDMERWALPSVPADESNLRRGILLEFGLEVQFFDCDPCALRNLEVLTQVTPLPISDDGIPDSGYNATYLQGSIPVQFANRMEGSPPPWGGTIWTALGILGIGWGWRNDRRRPWSVLAFLLGVVLLSCGFLSVLRRRW